MTTDISFAADMTELAEASYANFILKTDSAVETALKINGMKFSATQAEEFVTNWTVLDQQQNTDNGFSATLFQSKIDGSLVFATRGTEPVMPDLSDADWGDIVLDGLATDQIIDMYNYWQYLRQPAGTVYGIALLTRKAD